MDQENMTDQVTATCSQKCFLNQDLTVTDQISAPLQPISHIMSSQYKQVSDSSDLIIPEDRLSNGTREVESQVELRCSGDSERLTAEDEYLALSNDGISEFPNSDLSLPEVCISTNSDRFEDDMNYEVQQAYKIFTSFLSDKHKGITSSFLHPIGHHEARHGIEGVQGRVQSQLRQSMCLRRIEEKFINQEYETITEFVADFRLMLENCYRYHGVDHWISKQAQKLEIMLEQKLTLLSRTLREKTTLAVTSKGRFGAEEEWGSGGTSTRKRQASRYFATTTVGGHESVMVQALRLEEQQRAKEEKRQRELEKKEAEEMSAKEVEEWEQNLLSQASPYTVDTLWELPAIGHFLCLAQTSLNLPEIVFFELERCLLMPRCSLLLSKIMSSLLSPPQRRATLHRRPALPYRRWESELRQRVVGWYQAVGASRDQPHRAEQLGLCHQFFSILGVVSPLEEKPFHLLPFYQRVWLLKGLCDHVYETQKDVQDAVLAQPIHECRESILGYDSKENAYIHFPHFCGADLRIYCQSPSTPPAFPFPSVLVKRVETEVGKEGEKSDIIKNEADKTDVACDGAQMKTEDCEDFGKRVTETLGVIKKEKGDEDKKRFQLWSLMKEVSESGSSNGQSCENSKLGVQLQTNSLFFTHIIEGSDVKMSLKEEFSKVEQQSKQEKVSLVSERTIKAETQDPCLNVGEHSYMGRSPASSTALGSPSKPLEVKIEAVSPSQGHQTSPCSECCKSKDGNSKSAKDMCCSATPRQTSQLSSESAQNSSEERVNDKIWTKKKKRKKKRARDQLVGVKREHKHLEHKEKLRLPQTESAKSAVQKVPASIKRKDKKKKHKTGERNEFSKKSTDEAPPVASFKLVCSNLDELRELISKTEDELDELESMKKRLGRWYYKKESVKELHGTLIRLLNELLPWEPKLVKAYQRNRLRLKKEFDDFKKHPEYSNFVREECVSSSSSDDDYDYEDRDLDKDRCGELEEEDDQEHVVPRGLWSGGSTREFGAESAAEERMTCAPLNNLKHPLSFKEKGVGLLPSTQGVNTNITSAETRKEFSSEPISTNPSRDSAWTTGRPANISVSPTYPVLNPTCGLPKGYTPIPTLLAKSVGNKVTLMKRPTDFPSSVDGQSKGLLVSLPTSTVPNPKVSKAQSFPSSQHQNLQQMTTQVLKQMQVFEQPGVKMAPLPKMPQAKTSQTEPKSPVQVVFKAPEGLGHLVRKDGSSQVKMSVHSVMDQKPTEKVMQQVVFLPSNFLIKKSETQSTIVNPKQSKGIQVAVSKVATPVCISTDVPCFSIPENKIPVQQVDTLKETRTGKNPNPSFPLHLQRGALNTSGLKGTQMCSIQSSTPTEGVSTSSPITTLSKVVSTETVKLTEPKQELKTVCIRDSQSILVTTRGGNTGIVKVQTSSDQNSLGSFPTSSVITISPQLKAFLVSKTLSTFSASAPSQTYPSTVPAVTSISVAQTQKHGPKFTNSTLAAVTSSIPVTSPESQTTSAAVALSHGSSISDHSTAEKLFSQPLHAVSPGPTFPDSRLKNAVVVPSPSSAGVSPALTQEFIRKTTGVKRSSADESSQATKYFLVTPPPSSSASNKPASKGTPSSTKSVTKSKVILISQPTVTSSSTFTGHLPKQVTAAGSGQGLISSLSSQKLKVGLTSAQPMVGVSSEELSKASSGTLPSGVAISFLGKTTSIGQTIGALSHPPSTTIPVSLSGSNFPTAAPTTGLVPLTTLINVTNCSTQLATSSSVTTGFPFQGIPPISIIPQTSCSRSTAPSLPTGNMNKKDCGILASASSSNSPTQAITVSGGSPTQTYTPTLGPKPLYIKSSIRENTPLQSSSQLGHNKTQTTFSSAPTTSATGLVQQRIMINTSTHLTAGTQIFVNNARFVVPPHGLGPGSHMLIISGPESQVPTDTPISAGPSVAPKGASPTTVTPRATVLPQSAARLPGVPAVSSPFVACTPAVGSSLLARTPHATPFRLKGMPGLGSALTPSKTNAVSALPRFPSGHAGNFPLPPVCTSTLVSSPPAIVSSVVTNNSALVSSLAAVKIPAGTATHDKSSPTISAVSAAVPQLKGALPCSPVSPSSSAGALYSTVKPVSAPFSSAVASIVTDTAALHSSLPGQQVVVMTTLAPTKQPEQTAVRVGVPSTVQPQCLMQTGPGNSVGKQKPVLSGTRTLPAVSVSPIITTVSRTQALPIATIPPVENTVSTFEMAPGGAAPPSSTFVITSQSAQPITSLTMKNAIHQPVILTNKSLGKDSVQMSALGTHASVPSRLLISPDGAVLNSVQCQLNPAEPTACPRPLDALEISPNSSSGALHPLDSTLQPPQADTKVNQKNTEPAT